jgi:pimeloyl-ACP methyl ester carboxylesterase
VRTALLISLLLIQLSGCTRLLAERLVEAQNLNLHDLRNVDASAETLRAYYVTKQLRVPVGPPRATLSVWIMDPLGRPGTVTVYADATGQPGLRVRLDPTTEPATRAALRPKGTLFILHGIGDQKQLVGYQFWSTILRGEGYRVVLVDLRGHGRSTGMRLTYGVGEARDLAQLLDALLDGGEIVGDVGVLGASYGAATAIQWAAIDPRVKAVVALEPFSTLRDAARDAWPTLLGKRRWMFSDGSVQDAVSLAGSLANFDPDTENPLRAIAKTRTPILLIHGKDDTFLKPAQSERLHAAAPDHTKLVLVDGANHFNLWLFGYPTIRAESLPWFGRYLSGPTTAPATAP